MSCEIVKNSNNTSTSILVNLSPSSKEFETVSEIVDKTCPEQCIILIQKIENKLLTERFDNYKNKINAKYEVFGFHGTDSSSLDSICSEGFNKAYNKRAAYGLGTYLASSFGYSKAYSKQGKYEYKIMLICKIAYNNACRGSPNRPCPEGYDIQVDKLNETQSSSSKNKKIKNSNGPSIYSVHNDEAILPLYVIHFF